jgi:geranylgeranyl diphosphate synthase type I
VTVLLAAAAAGGNWTSALPAAAAVELIHNFSLVHDDVQDNSPKRRGRPTVWKKWGVPMAINVGDALFVTAFQALTDLSASYPAETALRATSILQNACLDLTRGQYLDMAYEGRCDLSLEDYWQMVGGKTSALLSACMEIGALLGGASKPQQEACRQFGYRLGLAFQVQDDVLGVWGDEAVTGKSAASDLAEGKNSLPVLYGLSRGGNFAERWKRGPIQADEVRETAEALEQEGGRKYAEEIAQRETDAALDCLKQAALRGPAADALLELANTLLRRAQ